MRIVQRTKRIAAMIAIAIICLTCVSTLAQHGRPRYVADELVCKMRPGHNIDSINQAFGTSVKNYAMRIECYLLATQPGENLDSLSIQIRMRPDVIYCGPNFYCDAPEPLQRSQPFLDEQSIGDFPTQLAASELQLSEVHTLSTGVGVDVAVIDGGVNFSHPLFVSQPGIIVSGWDYIDNDSIANDEPGGPGSGHGTFVAGVVNLVAPGARIHAYRVLDTLGSGDGFSISLAALRAMDEGCRVVNLSLGMLGKHEALDDALRYLKTHNVMILGAAGNDSTAVDSLFPFPASEPYTEAIAALDSLDHKTDFSNFGGRVDFCAPGTSIYAPYLNSSYAWWDGTSFSTPFVSGMAALLCSLDSTLTWTELDSIMSATAISVDSLNPGLEGKLGHGMINILTATQGLSRETCGDADHSGTINISDAVFLIAYIFAGGTAPYSITAADADCSGSIDISDAVTLISYIFSGGTPPCRSCLGDPPN
jgi:subtilisin family serine protease